MVVTAIIGLLMAAGIVVFTSTQNKARTARIKADFDAIYKSIEQIGTRMKGKAVLVKKIVFDLWEKMERTTPVTT
ncbi:hypothetical protein H3C70_03600 [Patescibacteria group bacterium]|nr:hypothetical protein [Patescibacteria group bacterium]